MRSWLTLFLIAVFFSAQPGKSQVLCIDCFDQNAAISPAAVNMIINGSFETTTCLPIGMGWPHVVPQCGRIFL